MATRTTATAAITWQEDESSGRGYLIANFDDGGRHELCWHGGRITAASDSYDVAYAIAGDLALDVLDVTHDSDCIHATMRQR